MALVDQVELICRNLAEAGWKSLFAQHGLHFSGRHIKTELQRRLPGINRGIPGFADFSLSGCRGIEPGIPSQSLVYHALASPLVRLTNSSARYPTLEEIDTIENYIYSLTNCSLDDFEDPVIGVFAYQYRCGITSPHGLFADMAFSRVGISRIGTAPQNYRPDLRSYSPLPSGGNINEIAVMPSRFAAFVAVRQSRDRRTQKFTGVILDPLGGDKGRHFWYPVHKLFPGKECLKGLNLDLEFSDFHVNEKLAKLHAETKLKLAAGFNLKRGPFVRTSADLVALQSAGSSCLLVPKCSPTLVHEAIQKNTRSRRDEIVHFTVPRATSGTRYWTSLQVEPNARQLGRMAPEYVNIRHKVQRAGERSEVIDLSAELKNRVVFQKTVEAGGYKAAHYTDNTCDGYITVRVQGLKAVSIFPAYSIVAAPHFFPLVNQSDITRWFRRSDIPEHDQFAQGSPRPLSSNRYAANPALLLRGTRRPAFDRNDHTMTAVLGVLHMSVPQERIAGSIREDQSTTFLPDGASGIFEPGWDISASKDQHGFFYAAYVLGSPFPEDAKLCAALNSFWPAAAPDTSRTFALDSTSPTAIPMLDSELGIHPHHPAAKNNGSSTGWDGEQGPFLEVVNGKEYVNYCDPLRSDYVSNALAKKITLQPFAEVSSAELIDRMSTLRACIQVLPEHPPIVSRTHLLLVSATKVADWSREATSSPALSGSGYRFVFVRPGGPKDQPTSDFRRLRLSFRVKYTCLIELSAHSVKRVCFAIDSGPFQCVEK